jgi:pimeloyl-ACP methyl ester carboxylesterase
MTDPSTHHVAVVNGFRMHYVIAGSGYPLVLLHGWPQSSYEWRKIIPALADRFTVIAPDLRGLGDSDRPITGYDKRTLASDVYALARSLGFSKIGLTGHDWGGVVAYYLAYDHPELVERLMILDSIPGLGRSGDKIDRETAKRLWHVFFHAGIPDLAEKLISANLEAYLRYFYNSTTYNYSPAVFTNDDIAEYVRVYSAPGAVRAGLQYYRTALQEDLENLGGCARKLRLPIAAWGGEGFLGNIVPSWQSVAQNVQGGAVEQCGHFIPEEKPEFTIRQALEFFDPFQKRI